MKTVTKRVHILGLYIKSTLDMTLKTCGLSLSNVSGVTTEPDVVHSRNLREKGDQEGSLYEVTSFCTK